MTIKQVSGLRTCQKSVCGLHMRCLCGSVTRNCAFNAAEGRIHIWLWLHIPWFTNCVLQNLFAWPNEKFQWIKSGSQFGGERTQVHKLCWASNSWFTCRVVSQVEYPSLVDLRGLLLDLVAQLLGALSGIRYANHISLIVIFFEIHIFFHIWVLCCQVIVQNFMLLKSFNAIFFYCTGIYEKQTDNYSWTKIRISHALDPGYETSNIVFMKFMIE